MREFPLIHKLGLQLWRIDSGYVCPAQNVESLLQSAQEVKGFYRGDLQIWGTGKNDQDTHSAKLILIEAIPKEPLKLEFDATVRPGDKGLYPGVEVVEKLKGKKFRFVAEEIMEEES